MTESINPAAPTPTRRPPGQRPAEEAPATPATAAPPVAATATVRGDQAAVKARGAKDPMARLTAAAATSPGKLGEAMRAHQHPHVHHKGGPDPQSKYGIKLEHGEQKYAEGLKKFEADTRKKVDEFAARLKADPEYQKAANPETWKKMSLKEKQAFADHVAKLQGEVFGFKPAPTVMKRTPPGKDGLEYGSYEDSTNKLTINSHPKAIGNFKEFMDTVAHEQFHAYQHQLTQHKYPPDHPLHAPSEVYKINDKHYHERPYGAYRRQPSEAHAFMVGERVRAALFGGK